MIKIGALFHIMQSKGWSSFELLARELGNVEYMYYAFGNHIPENKDFLDFYSFQPSQLDKEFIYSECDIWFSDTKMEGFHNVPAEAALFNCLIVCNRVNSNGMGDYATEETAERFSSIDEAVRIIKNPDWLKRDKMKVVLNAIGSREYNMSRFASLIK